MWTMLAFRLGSRRVAAYQAASPEKCRMRNYRRTLVIVLISMGFAGSSFAGESPERIEAAKVCTKTCGAKHGAGPGKGKKKYEPAAYEICMNHCAKERLDDKRSPASSKR